MAEEVVIKIKGDSAAAVAALEKLGSKFSVVSKNAGGLEGAFKKIKTNWLAFTAATAGAVIALKEAFNITKEAAVFNQSALAMQNQFGVSADAMIKSLKMASDGTLSAADAISVANRAMALNVTKDVGEIAKLYEVARVRARAMGTDATQAFQDLVTGIGRGSPLILDNLGIITTGWDAEAKATGKAYDSQFILNKVLEDGANILKKTGPLTANASDNFARMTAVIKDVRLMIGQELLVAVQNSSRGFASFERAEGIISNLRKAVQVLVAIFTISIENIKTPFILWFNAVGLVYDAIVNLGKIAKAVFESDFKGVREVIDGFKGLFNTIVSVGGKAVDLVVELGRTIKSVFQGDFKNIDEIISNVKKPFEIFLGSVGIAIDAVLQLGKAFKSVFTGDFKGVKEAAAEFKDKVSARFTNLKDTVVDQGKTIVKSIQHIGKQTKSTAEVMSTAIDGMIIDEEELFAQMAENSSALSEQTKKAEDDYAKQKEALGSAVTEISSEIGSTISQIAAIGKGVIAVIDAISSSTNPIVAVIQLVVMLVKIAINAIKYFLKESDDAEKAAQDRSLKRLEEIELKKRQAIVATLEKQKQAALESMDVTSREFNSKNPQVKAYYDYLQQQEADRIAGMTIDEKKEYDLKKGYDDARYAAEVAFDAQITAAKKKQVAVEKEIALIKLEIDRAAAIADAKKQFWGKEEDKQVAAIKSLYSDLKSAIKSAATGANFTTSGPQLMLVGDNPTGRERVSVVPEEQAAFAGGGGGNFIFENITVVSNDPKDFIDKMVAYSQRMGSRMFRR